METKLQKDTEFKPVVDEINKLHGEDEWEDEIIPVVDLIDRGEKR